MLFKQVHEYGRTIQKQFPFKNIKKMDEVKEINDGLDLQLVRVNQSPSADNNSKQIVPKVSFQE